MTEKVPDKIPEKIDQEKKAPTKEENFAELRKSLEREQAERKRMQMKIEELEEERLRRETELRSRPQQKEEDEEDEGDDVYIDKRFLKKNLRRMEEKMLQEMEKRAAKKAEDLLAQERESEYLKKTPDFYNVLSEENIQDFCTRHQGFAEMIARLPQGFQRNRMLYEAIKLEKGKEKKEEPIQDRLNRNFHGSYYTPSSQAPPAYRSAPDFSPEGQKASWERQQELKRRITGR